MVMTDRSCCRGGSMTPGSRFLLNCRLGCHRHPPVLFDGGRLLAPRSEAIEYPRHFLGAEEAVSLDVPRDDKNSSVRQGLRSRAPETRGREGEGARAARAGGRQGAAAAKTAKREHDTKASAIDAEDARWESALRRVREY